MVEIAKEKESLLCRYCQIDLDPIADRSNGFIKCPGCERNYLKLSKKSLPKSSFQLSLESKKVLDLYVSPAGQLAELKKLQEQLSAQEAVFNELKTQKEHFVPHEDSETLLIQVADLNNKNAELEHRLFSSESEVSHQVTLVNDRNKELIELKDALQLSKQQLAEKEELLFALQKEESFKNLTLANVQNDNIEAKTLLATKEEEVEALLKVVEELKAEVSILQDNLTVVPDLEMEIENAKLRASELQEIIDRSIYTTVGDEGVKQVELLNTEVLALKDDIKEYVKTIQLLEERVVAYEKAESASGVNAKQDSSIQSISALKDNSDKIEAIETELLLTRDELEKARAEIGGLNQMLEKAFYENQKSGEVVTTGTTDRVNTQMEAIKEQLSSIALLRQDLYLTRINADGEQKKAVLFEKGLVLPKQGLEVKKEVSYVVSRNKGVFLYESNEMLSLFHVDFSSNLNFFVSESEFNSLDKKDVQIAIREEYILKSDGSLEVVFYRNNGFKRFEQVIGKIETKNYELNLQ